MKEFSFSTRIFFGDNALERLSKVENKRVLMVTDSFMVTSGIAERVASYLTNCSVTVFSEVIPDPTVEVIAAGVKCLQQSKAEVMLAVGGGSAIDAAKAIRSIANQTNLEVTEITECFAVPTTSGTGSEVTEYAVITDAKKGIKYPLVSQDLRPPVAILDPSLVASAPPTITADSGMDVLTHAVESYVSTGANDFTDALAEKAIELVVQYLPVAYKDGSNHEAREKMHNASCMAGLAFNSAGLGVCHGLAHAIGAKLHIAHGRINAMILPHVIQLNADKSDSYVAEKFRRLAKIMDLPSYNQIIGVNQIVHMVKNLNRALSMPATLRAAQLDLQAVAAMESEIIDAALHDVTVAANPFTPSPEDIRALLRSIMG